MGNGPTHAERHETPEELLARIEATEGPEVAAVVRRAIEDPDAAAAAARKKHGARRRSAGVKGGRGADHAIPVAGPGERHSTDRVPYDAGRLGDWGDR